MVRSIYAKGFPEEETTGNNNARDGRRGGQQHSTRTQQELEKFFGSLGVGKVNAVRMRRDEQKKFKGSVFVEFATLESAKAFLELDPIPTYPGQDKPLEVMSKKAYVDMKAKEKGFEPQYKEAKDTSAAASDNKPQQTGNNRYSNNKKPFNAFRDWRDGKDMSEAGNRRDNRNNRDGGNSKASNEPVEVFVEGKKLEVDSETGKIKHPENIEYQSGKVARFEGASTSDSSDPIDLKRALQPIQACAFVDFERGSSSGIVFFKDVVSEDKLKALQDAALTLGGKDNKLEWTLVKDEEEKKFHVERAHKRASIALADAKSGNNGNGRDNDRRRNDGGGSDSRDSRDNNRGGRRDDRNDRGNGRDRDNNNNRKRERDDESGSSSVKTEQVDTKPKGNSISVPQIDSRGPTNDDGPAAKKVKTEVKTE